MRIQHESCRFTNLSFAALKKSAGLAQLAVLSNLTLEKHCGEKPMLFYSSSGSTNASRHMAKAAKLTLGKRQNSG
jgi:hypothetical protein